MKVSLAVRPSDGWAAWYLPKKRRALCLDEKNSRCFGFTKNPLQGPARSHGPQQSTSEVVTIQSLA